MKYKSIIIYVTIFIIATCLIYQFIKNNREPMDGYGVTVENSSGLSNFLNMFSKKDPPVEIDVNNTRTRREFIIQPHENVIVKPPFKFMEEGSNEEPVFEMPPELLPDPIEPEIVKPPPTPKPTIQKSPEYCAYNFGVKGKDMLLTCPENLPLCNGYSFEDNKLGGCGPKPTVIPKSIPKGATWTIPEEKDVNYKAYCRCVNEDSTKGVSICNSGCGDPNKVCNKTFGCHDSIKGCDKDKCTCKPYEVLIENKMTFNECEKQCKRIDMRMIGDSTDVNTANSTGCGINSSEMWVKCKNQDCK